MLADDDYIGQLSAERALKFVAERLHMRGAHAEFSGRQLERFVKANRERDIFCAGTEAALLKAAVELGL